MEAKVPSSGCLARMARHSSWISWSRSRRRQTASRESGRGLAPRQHRPPGQRQPGARRRALHRADIERLLTRIDLNGWVAAWMTLSYAWMTRRS